MPYLSNTSRKASECRYCQYQRLRLAASPASTRISAELLATGNVSPAATGFAHLPQDLRLKIYDNVCTQELSLCKPGSQPSPHYNDVLAALALTRRMSLEFASFVSEGARLVIRLDLSLQFLAAHATADFRLASQVQKKFSGSTHDVTYLHIEVQQIRVTRLRPLADLAWAIYQSTSLRGFRLT